MPWREVRFSEEAIDLINRINREIQKGLYKAAQSSAEASQDGLVVEEHVIKALASLPEVVKTLQDKHYSTRTGRRQPAGCF